MSAQASAVLVRAANAFEKLAVYFQKEATEEQTQKVAHLKSTVLDPIAERVPSSLNPKLAEKLAGLDPDVLGFIQALTAPGSVAASRHDEMSLGGPSEKLASSADDDPLLAFCSTED